MKRSGLVLGSLPFITGLCVAAGWLLPAVAQEPAASTPAETTAGDSSGLSDKEKALLQKLNALKTPRWRTFGPCQYDWSTWRLLPEGVRITSVQCSVASADGKEKGAPAATVSDSVAVHCDSLKLSIKSADQPWSSWRLPYSATESTARGSEDLMVVALQTGLTNVCTFMVGPERWDTPYLFDGLFRTPRSHHGMSHNQTKMIDDLLRVDRFHMEQYVYLLEKMEAVREADGSSMLDNTLFTYGSGLGDGSTHQYNDLPIIVAGSGGGKFKTGQHINMPEGTPLANLWLTQANALGLGIERFADSAGEIAAVKA